MKNKFKYAIFIVSVFGMFLYSCKKEQQPVLYYGYDYFPNNAGHYVIYQCDSIIFDPYKKTSPQFDTFQYQIKEVISSFFQNNSGQTTQRIVRYKRTDTTVAWSNILTPEKVWTGNLLSTEALRQEDNYVYVKLIFPPELNKTWNGNSYNTIGLWNYQYTTLNTPLTLNGTRFDSTLTILQQKDSNFLSYQYYFEQYATGIGMIHKVIIDYSTTNFFPAPPPIDSASSGTIFYSETYLSSGNE